MSNVSVDRKKLADYIRKYADVLAEQAYIELHTEKVETMAGKTMFYNSIDIEIREIPHEGLEVDK